MQESVGGLKISINKITLLLQTFILGVFIVRVSEGDEDFQVKKISAAFPRQSVPLSHFRWEFEFNASDKPAGETASGALSCEIAPVL